MTHGNKQRAPRPHEAVRYPQRRGIWEDLAEYYRRRGVDLGQFRQIVE